MLGSWCSWSELQIFTQLRFCKSNQYLFGSKVCWRRSLGWKLDTMVIIIPALPCHVVRGDARQGVAVIMLLCEGRRQFAELGRGGQWRQIEKGHGGKLGGGHHQWHDGRRPPTETFFVRWWSCCLLYLYVDITNRYQKKLIQDNWKAIKVTSANLFFLSDMVVTHFLTEGSACNTKDLHRWYVVSFCSQYNTQRLDVFGKDGKNMTQE